MTTVSAPELGRAEQEYVDHVADQLRWLPRRQRENLLDVLRQNLAERAGSPGSAGSQLASAAREVRGPVRVQSLSLELGGPAAYADTLIAEMEQANPGFTYRRRPAGPYR